MNEIMKGFPVAPENRVPMQEWDRSPWNRWSFQHVREILPTTEVKCDGGPPWRLRKNARGLGRLKFTTYENNLSTISDWLNTSFTDGFMVLHQGGVVSETYMNGMGRHSPHLSQSMSKSLTGCMAGVLIGRGLMNPEDPVTRYLPELESTGWNGATLRHVLDMTTGVSYVEDYTAIDSDMAKTDIASGWKSNVNGIDVPYCIWDQILSLSETVRPHGELFQYRSIETDVLAHCLERVSGKPLATLISDEIWKPLGCEDDAYFTVDKAGYALANGGFNATLRDYARFGQMLLQRGQANDRQVVPEEWVDDIQNGEGSLFGSPYTEAAPNGAYRNQFWVRDVKQRAFMARGVFGQLIYVDPDLELVVVKLSSWPEFVSVSRLITTLNAIDTIGNRLAGK